MKPKNHISIPNPCPASWDKMTPVENGRHCTACNKTVVDFTGMTPEQIGLYFLQSPGKKTCGHFYKGQLKTDKNKAQTFFTNLYCSAYLHIRAKAPRVLVLVVLSGVLTLTGCGTPTGGEVIEHEQVITGDSIAPVTHDKTLIDTTKKGL